MTEARHDLMNRSKRDLDTVLIYFTRGRFHLQKRVYILDLLCYFLIIREFGE